MPLKINKFLKMLFPKLNFYNGKNKLLLSESFLENNENYVLEILKELGYTNIATLENPTKNIITNKRFLNETKLFDMNEWFSPHSIKLALDEPFKIMIKELHPEKITHTNMEKITFQKGIEFEEYVVKILKEKLNKINSQYKITEICLEKPNLNNYQLLKDSFDAIERGDPVIYQPILFDSESHIWGVPDFLIRNDVLIKLCPNNSSYLISQMNLKNNFGNYFYYVVDVKLANSFLLKNGLLTNEKKTYLNKIQVLTYANILEKIQGKLTQNYGFILSPKTTFNNLTYPVLDYLGTIDFNQIPDEIPRAINIIKTIRKNKDIGAKNILKDVNFKPKRNKNFYFLKTVDCYTQSKKDFGFYIEPKFKINFNNFESLKEILSKYTLIYVDFETINLKLCFSPDEYQKQINSNNTLVAQIGMLYQENNEFNYRSFFSKNLDEINIINNFRNFVDHIKQLKKNNVGIITWGNLEKACYEDLKRKYSLPDIEIIDLYKLIKKSDIFSNKISLSLKNLIPNLSKKFPKDFPYNYKNLEINNGQTAFIELYNYYQNYDTNIKTNIEKYNYIDCVVMKQIVDWINKNG